MVTQMTHNQHFDFDVYIASCHEKGGIYKYSLTNEGMSFLYKKTLDRPMYLKVSNNIIYATLRRTYGVNGAFLTLEDNGTDINILNSTDTNGEIPAHFCVSDSNVYCTNYISGNVSKLPDKIVTHVGSSIVAHRQESPHTHYVCETYDGYLLVVDLGLDKIFTYTKELEKVAEIKLKPGRGPRHLIFSDDNKFVFCANELSSTVTVFLYCDGKLHFLSEHNSIKEYNSENFPAAIRYSNNKLYVSNRGHNSISVYTVLDEKIELSNVISCEGNWPRDINIFGNKLICTNEKSNNVVVFKINDNNLEPIVNIEGIIQPICVDGKRK